MTELREWAPDFDEWPDSWMGVDEDLVYGRKLLPYMERFLADLLHQGLSRRTFVRYKNDVWSLGGIIIKQVSLYDEYDVDPLEKLMESVEGDGVVPDDFEYMSEDELRAFERTCRRFEKFLIMEFGEGGASPR